MSIKEERRFGRFGSGAVDYVKGKPLIDLEIPDVKIKFVEETGFPEGTGMADEIATGDSHLRFVNRAIQISSSGRR